MFRRFACLSVGVFIIFTLVWILSDFSPDTSAPEVLISEISEEQFFFNCSSKDLKTSVGYRGNFVVLYNFVKATKRFKCYESITLTTPADFRFLDNVSPLVDVWRGPISVALYAPGDDFKTTLKSIAYLRNCETSLVKDLVTFHILFERAHIPKMENKSVLNFYEDVYDCADGPPFKKIADSDMYKTRNNLLYPINVARNVARITAETHFIFPSDIELYPIRNFIEKFLQMMKRQPSFLYREKMVFVLPIFEVLDNMQIPETKTELENMLKSKTAKLFHEGICKLCHRVPEGEKWVKAKESEGLGIFAVAKRQKRYKVWEPFYVGTNEEPLFDERLTWEGQSNKMSQAYSLCLLDYDFAVLNNAFLIHKPGIKKEKEQVVKHNDEVKKTTNTLKTIKKELITLYGNNSNCLIAYKL